ncbi:hypothetical protein FRB97_004338 [Tulasnella sp. 331]|nr:hypothetical protein FRB97_004338 [Tulasnella sp. 331]
MSTIAQDPILPAQFDKSDVVAMPSVQSTELLPVPTLGSSTAPEYAQMMDLVKGSIESINDIVDLLNHPKENKPNLLELIYTLATIRSFKVRVIECNHSLEAANATASAWLFSVNNHLEQVNNDLAQVQERIKETEEFIANNLQLIQNGIKTLSQSLPSMEERSRLERHGSSENARAIAALVPIISTALTIAEVSQDDEEVSSADRAALMDIATSLREYRQQGLRLEAELASIKVTETDILNLQAKLHATAQFLDPLKVNFEFCIRVVSAGFALSGLTGKPIDTSASMEQARTAIKSLADAFDITATYWGVFVTLSDQGCAELDQRIKALRNKEKPVDIPPAPVVVPVVEPEIAEPLEAVPIPCVEPPQVPATIEVPQVIAPQPEVQQGLPLTEEPNYPRSPTATEGTIKGLVSEGTQYIAPVGSMEFKTTLVSPIAGWEIVGVHLIQCMYGKPNGPPSTTTSWEPVGMHLVRPGTFGGSCYGWGAVQTQSVGAPTTVSIPIAQNLVAVSGEPTNEKYLPTNPTSDIVQPQFLQDQASAPVPILTNGVPAGY